MSTESTVIKAMRGGEFVITDTNANDIFTPEEINEEQKNDQIDGQRFCGYRTEIQRR